MLHPRADTGLQNRISAMGHRPDTDQPAFFAGRSCVAREFRHGITGIAALIFTDSSSGKDFPFDDIFRIGNGIFLYGQAGTQPDRLSAQRPCYGQFIKSQRGGRRFKTGSEGDSRIHADADGYRQGLPQLLGPFRHSPDMSGARSEKMDSSSFP